MATWIKRTEWLAGLARQHAQTEADMADVEQVLTKGFHDPITFEHGGATCIDHMASEIAGWKARAKVMSGLCRRLHVEEVLVNDGMRRFQPNAPRVTLVELEAGLAKMRRKLKGLRYPKEEV